MKNFVIDKRCEYCEKKQLCNYEKKKKKTFRKSCASPEKHIWLWRTPVTVSQLCFLKCVKHTSSNRDVTGLFTCIGESNILQVGVFCWLHQCRHQVLKGVQITVSIWHYFFFIFITGQVWNLYLDSINHLQIVFRHLIKYQRDAPVKCKWFLWQKSVIVKLWVILKIWWQTRVK